MRHALFCLLAVAVASSPLSATDVEDFEHGNPGLYTLSTGTTHNMSTTAGAAHDGALGAAFGAGTTPWLYRTDVTTQPGKSYFCYVRLTGSGRIYIGVRAGVAGCMSVVASPNTSELLIQRNTGWGYTDLATAPYTYTYGIWYLMELEWATNGDMTARLWDEAGTTKLAETPTVATGQVTPGGLALRAFGGSPTQDVDTITEACSGGLSSVEVTRAGAVPNPIAFMPGVTSGPVIGATWDPFVDHTTFLPGAAIDAAVVTVRSLDSPTPFGSLLCDLSTQILLQTGAPGAPFAIPIPDDCSLLGLGFCTQAGSVTATGAIGLANAIDIVIGSN